MAWKQEIHQGLDSTVKHSEGAAMNFHCRWARIATASAMRKAPSGISPERKRFQDEHLLGKALFAVKPLYHSRNGKWGMPE
jgi:hypothetical protein